MSEHQEQAHQPIPRREWDALADIAHCGSSQYVWRQASMRKLEARGFVQQTGVRYGEAVAYAMTEAGRAYWERNRKVGNGWEMRVVKVGGYDGTTAD